MWAVSFLHEADHLGRLAEEVGIDLEGSGAGHVLDGDENLAMSDLCLKIPDSVKPAPEFQLQAHPGRRVEVDQRDTRVDGQGGSAQELVDLVPPTVDFKKGCMQGADRENGMQVANQGRVVLVLEIMIDDDFHAVETGIPGDFECLRHGECIEAAG